MGLLYLITNPVLGKGKNSDWFAEANSRHKANLQVSTGQESPCRSAQNRRAPAGQHRRAHAIQHRRAPVECHCCLTCISLIAAIMSLCIYFCLGLILLTQKSAHFLCSSLTGLSPPFKKNRQVDESFLLIIHMINTKSSILIFVFKV